MDRRLITTGLLAGFVFLGWKVVSQGLLPIRDELGYKDAQNEERVLSTLDANLPGTGLYIVPGHSPPDSLFRARYSEGPIFRIHSLRRGAGGTPHFLVSILALFIAPMIPTALVWRLCRNGGLGFGARATTVALFGVFLALAADIQLWGTELYPLNYSIFLASSSVVGWAIVGLVVAWRIRPTKQAARLAAV
jgi:hypothetical protein